MARYDFLDEETRDKLEERQKSMITRKKKNEIKRKKEGREDRKRKGPQVYTTENGKIGGVIYPEDQKKESSKPSEQIMGEEEVEEKKMDSDPDPEDDLPIKLHHTQDTRVGTENRPEPPKKEDLEEKEREKREENTEEEDEAIGKIWQ